MNKKKYILFDFLKLYNFTKFITKKYPIVLVYHRFGITGNNKQLSVDIFEEQIKILKKNFTIIRLDDFYNIINNNQKIPDNTVVITIDDGYEDFYTHAYPVLKKYSVPATLFITTNFVNKKIWLWPDRLDYIVNNSDIHKLVQFLEKREIDVNDINKNKIWSILADLCLNLNDYECNLFINELLFFCNIVSFPEFAPDKYQALNWDQIKEMHSYGIEIGSHTCNHFRLTKLDETQLIFELNESKKMIEKQLCTKVKSISYPFGGKEDINKNVKYLTEKAGYLLAAVGYFNLCVYNDLFEIKRLGVNNDLFDFKNKIYGINVLNSFFNNTQFDR